MTTEADTTNLIPTLQPQSTGMLNPLTPSQLIWRRFRKHRMALI